MSWEMLGIVLDMPITKEFNSELKFTALAYANFANANGENMYPSKETIAQITGYHERSIIRYRNELVRINILIPDGIGRKGTKKYKFSQSLIGGDTQSPHDKRGDSPSGDNPSGDTQSPEPNKPFNSIATADIFTEFKSEIGKITPKIKADLNTLIDNHPMEWILEAIQIASKNEIRKINYITSILERWNTEGKDDGRKKKKNEVVNIEKQYPKVTYIDGVAFLSHG